MLRFLLLATLLMVLGLAALVGLLIWLKRRRYTRSQPSYCPVDPLHYRDEKHSDSCSTTEWIYADASLSRAERGVARRCRRCHQSASVSASGFVFEYHTYHADPHCTHCFARANVRGGTCYCCGNSVLGDDGDRVPRPVLSVCPERCPACGASAQELEVGSGPWSSLTWPSLFACTACHKAWMVNAANALRGAPWSKVMLGTWGCPENFPKLRRVVRVRLDEALVRVVCPTCGATGPAVERVREESWGELVAAAVCLCGTRLELSTFRVSPQGDLRPILESGKLEQHRCSCCRVDFSTEERLTPHGDPRRWCCPGCYAGEGSLLDVPFRGPLRTAPNGCRGCGSNLRWHEYAVDSWVGDSEIRDRWKETRWLLAGCASCERYLVRRMDRSSQSHSVAPRVWHFPCRVSMALRLIVKHGIALAGPGT